METPQPIGSYTYEPPPNASRWWLLLRPLGAPYRKIRGYFDRWLFQLHGAQSGSIVLAQRRIFILPSRYGLIYLVALLLMLTGSINYNLSLGFVLTFLLAALGVYSILHTFRNLARTAYAAEMAALHHRRRHRRRHLYSLRASDGPRFRRHAAGRDAGAETA